MDSGRVRTGPSAGPIWPPLRPLLPLLFRGLNRLSNLQMQGTGFAHGHIGSCCGSSVNSHLFLRPRPERSCHRRHCIRDSVHRQTSGGICASDGAHPPGMAQVDLHLAMRRGRSPVEVRGQSRPSMATPAMKYLGAGLPGERWKRVAAFSCGKKALAI